MVEGFKKAPLEIFLFDNVVMETKTAGQIKYAQNWKAVKSEFKYLDQGKVIKVDCSSISGF